MPGKLGWGRDRGNGQNKTARAKAGGSTQTLRDLLLGRGPRDALDVRTADADVGELAVAEVVQLGNALVVALPGADDANKAGKHGRPLKSEPVFPVPAIGRFDSLRGK